MWGKRFQKPNPLVAAKPAIPSSLNWTRSGTSTAAPAGTRPVISTTVALRIATPNSSAGKSGLWPDVTSLLEKSGPSPTDTTGRIIASIPATAARPSASVTSWRRSSLPLCASAATSNRSRVEDRHRPSSQHNFCRDHDRGCRAIISQPLDLDVAETDRVIVPGKPKMPARPVLAWMRMIRHELLHRRHVGIGNHGAIQLTLDFRALDGDLFDSPLAH